MAIFNSKLLVYQRVTSTGNGEHTTYLRWWLGDGLLLMDLQWFTSQKYLLEHSISVGMFFFLVDRVLFHAELNLGEYND